MGPPPFPPLPSPLRSPPPFHTPDIWLLALQRTLLSEVQSCRYAEEVPPPVLALICSDGLRYSPWAASVFAALALLLRPDEPEPRQLHCSDMVQHRISVSQQVGLALRWSKQRRDVPFPLCPANDIVRLKVQHHVAWLKEVAFQDTAGVRTLRLSHSQDTRYLLAVLGGWGQLFPDLRDRLVDIS